MCDHARSAHPTRPYRLDLGAGGRAVPLTQGVGEPTSTAADDVRGILADGAQARRGAQRHLLGGERRDSAGDVLLILFPRIEDGREGKALFSHTACLFSLDVQNRSFVDDSMAHGLLTVQ